MLKNYIHYHSLIFGMCGIVGYVGKNNNAVDIVLEGLKQLEYRGYDSAGIAAQCSPEVFLRKKAGRVNVLAEAVKDKKPVSSCAIAHTRWATHGAPTDINAHPHHDCKKKIFVVHNGIIENYGYLKSVLEREGHSFSSDTDTEVLAHLIERHSSKHTSLEDAVIAALFHVKGTFALAVISEYEPDKIVVARRSSPLVIGLTAGGYFLASDTSAIAAHTKKVIYLDDDEVAVLKSDLLSFYDFKKKIKQKPVDIIDWDMEQAKKEGFAHFMLKEIHQQPDSITDSLRGRLVPEENKAKLGGLEVLEDKIKDIKKIIITACGTAYYAGMAGKYMFENYAGISVEVDLASEFRYRNPKLDKDTAILIISQSGETADSLAALRYAKKNGCLALGIVNTVGSSIARETNAGVFNHIGPEIGVASTKAFTSQLVVLALFSLFFGRENGLGTKKAEDLTKHLYLLPAQIKKILKSEDNIKQLAEKYGKFSDFLFLGRGYNYPIALEGALKLKEVSYIHAEGYPAGEMKHGPIALIDKNFPTMAIVGSPTSNTYEKIISNLEEIKARGGPIIAVAEETLSGADEKIKKIADDVFYIPKTADALSPVLSVVPLQLFAYYAGVSRGIDVDKPRNLAKSVTVE